MITWCIYGFDLAVQRYDRKWYNVVLIIKEFKLYLTWYADSTHSLKLSCSRLSVTDFSLDGLLGIPEKVLDFEFEVQFTCALIHYEDQPLPDMWKHKGSPWGSIMHFVQTTPILQCSAWMKLSQVLGFRRFFCAFCTTNCWALLVTILAVYMPQSGSYCWECHRKTSITVDVWSYPELYVCP